MNELNYAMDAYLGELARAQRTKATRNKYQWWLWQFAAFLEREGVIECDRVTRDLCRRFLDRWRDSSESTMAGGHTVLTQFFLFLERETVLPLGGSPMHGIARPKRRHPDDLEVVTVSSEDVAKLFGAADGWQETLCLAVLVYLGPRRSAAAAVRRRDVHLEQLPDGTWAGSMRFREKGGKRIRKPMPDELVALIRAADQQGVWPNEDAYLIPNRRPARNRERSSVVVYDTVKKIADRVGLNCHVHALRAAFAVHFAEQQPGRIIALKELLGHSRLDTTQVYLRRQDKTREMAAVRGLSWGSVFPSFAGMPPAGFEPALPSEADREPLTAETARRDGFLEGED